MVYPILEEQVQLCQPVRAMAVGPGPKEGGNVTQGIDSYQTLNLHVVSNLNETLIQTQRVQGLESQPPTL